MTGMMPWMGYTPRTFECLCAAMEDDGFRKPSQRPAAEAEKKQEGQKSQKSEPAIRELRREHVRRGESVRNRKTVKSVPKKKKGEFDKSSIAAQAALKKKVNCWNPLT